MKEIEVGRLGIIWKDSHHRHSSDEFGIVTKVDKRRDYAMVLVGGCLRPYNIRSLLQMNYREI